MSWDRGIFQPWMNMTASFFSFSFQGYLRVLNSPAKWGLCVLVCWMTPWYPHLDLGLKNHHWECVCWLHFLSLLHSPDRPVHSSEALTPPLPLKAIHLFLPPPAPPPPHPIFPPSPVPLFSNWSLTDWQCFPFPSFFSSFLPSFLKISFQVYTTARRFFSVVPNAVITRDKSS